jgi:hypothetical protein
MNCPRCGAQLPAGGTCPACGWVGQQIVQQQVTGRADEPTTVEFTDVCKTPAQPAPEVPVPYPNMDRTSDHGARSVKVDGEPVSVPDTELPPSEGDEPGTGGSGPSRLPGGAPLLVAGIVIVLVVVVATFILLSGDGNDGNNSPDGGLVIDPNSTMVETVWEPNPGFHLNIAILNKADDTTSLGGHDLLVTVLDGSQEVGRTTMALSGDVAAGHGRGVLIDVGVALTSGKTYKVNILLRDEDGKTVDSYNKEVTVPVT